MGSDAVNLAGRRRGRPAGFDRPIALQQAMRLFWDQGYEGTSFDDLATAMGISPSSFYNTFGSKRALYQEAVEAYVEKSSAWFTAALGAAPDARSAIHAVMCAGARMYTQSEEPTGCMIATACINVPPELQGLRDYMAEQRQAAEAAMAARIRRGMADGDTASDTDPDALAAFYGAVSRGLVIQARDGASCDRLLEVVDLAMRAWPAHHGRGTTGSE